MPPPGGAAAFSRESSANDDPNAPPMDKRTKDTLVATLAVAAVVVSVYFTFANRSPKIDLDPYEVLGVVAAEETAKLLPDKGRVLVMARDTGADKNPSVEAQLKAFQQTLKKHPGLSQVTVPILATASLMMATGGGVPPDQLFQALEAHPDARAVVLLCALPALSDAELATLKRHGAKLVVVSSFRPDYRRLLEQNLLHIAIVPRPEGPPPDAKPPRTLRERFDREYVIVTPAGLDPR